MKTELRSRRSARRAPSRTAARRTEERPAPRRAHVPVAFAEPETAEWLVAWQGLEDASGDSDREAFDDRSGEVWQYMGSAFRDGVWVHEFRHRNHPRTQQRWLLRVPASPDWAPTEALKSLLLAGAASAPGAPADADWFARLRGRVRTRKPSR